jgi:PIN domain nuclease of toxin-antitoxin system
MRSLWAVSNPDRLSDLARAALSDPESEVIVSAISSAEIACASENGRVKLDRHWKTWFRTYLELNDWTCVPIGLPEIEEAYSLPPPFHSDPADRIIVGTARIENIPIVTGDKRIIDYPHVHTIW